MLGVPATGRGPAQGLFVGLASPEEVRWALAGKFPALERAYARACAKQANQNAYGIKSTQGALEPFEATQVVQAFLGEIQKADAPTQAEEGEWVELAKAGPWEEARWISAEDVSSVLGDALHDPSVSGDWNALGDDQHTALLRSQGDFVALVGQGWTFNGLVDRRATLEALGTAV